MSLRKLFSASEAADPRCKDCQWVQLWRDLRRRRARFVYLRSKAPTRAALVRLNRRRCARYFSASFTLVKVVSSFDPSWPTTVMIAIEMPAAMRPYSMAVAPLSSTKTHRTAYP